MSASQVALNPEICIDSISFIKTRIVLNPEDHFFPKLFCPCRQAKEVVWKTWRLCILAVILSPRVKKTGCCQGLKLEISPTYSVSTGKQRRLCWIQRSSFTHLMYHSRSAPKIVESLLQASGLCFIPMVVSLLVSNKAWSKPRSLAFERLFYPWQQNLPSEEAILHEQIQAHT